MKIHPKGEPTHWLPCGKCLGCREMQQQQLVIRITHEARNATDKHFLTLTYDDDHLPKNQGLQKRDMQLFWKRVRKMRETKRMQHRSTQTVDPLKQLTCGEYGDRTRRAHYHAAAINLEIDDLKKWDTENSRSETIEKAWGNGIVTISELTEGRIKYVAGYVLKKAGYKKQIYCTEEGEELQPPYRDMSKGLGKQWIMKYQTDLRNGYLQEQGAKYTIPRYYRDIIKSTNPELDKFIREQQAKNWKELTPEDRRLLHTAEKIRSKEIREGKNRDRI